MTPIVLTSLPWWIAFCSRSSCAEQEFVSTNFYEKGTWKQSKEKNSRNKLIRWNVKNKAFLAKANPAVVKTMFCNHTKPSNSQSTAVGYCSTKASKKLRCLGKIVPSLDASEVVFFNQSAKIEERESWAPCETSRQKLQRLYIIGETAVGSLYRRGKASNLPVSNLEQLLNSNATYAKLTPVFSFFDRVKTSARFGVDKFSVDLTYEHKLGDGKKGGGCLLVLKDFFGRFVNAKAVKTNGRFEKNFKRFLKTKNTKNRLDRSQKML